MDNFFPDHDQIDAMQAQATRLMKAGKLQQAVSAYESLLAQAPGHFEALYQLGLISFKSGQGKRAIDYLERAARVQQDETIFHFYLGSALLSRARFDDALKALEKAVELKPEFADAHINRGIAFVQLGQRTEALACFDQALAAQPDHVTALCNRGGVLRELDQNRDALEAFERALAMDPDNLTARYNLGMCLMSLGEIPQATLQFSQIAEKDSNFAPAQWNLGVCHLLQGNFELGWRLHEWRWRNEHLESSRYRPQFRQPLWLGREVLDGKTIFVYAEQGLGDTLQFCRYAPILHKLGVNVVLGVQATLAPLLRQSLPNIKQVVASGEPLPPFDSHCPLMSLPLALESIQKTIPSSIPYLKASADQVSNWLAELPSNSKRRIGLVWSGRAAHANDRNRSIPLATLLPLLADSTEGTCFISVQKEVRPEDAELLNKRPEVLALGTSIGDFSDTAALVANLDLLITVDTSLAHLAGALGTPVWVLLPFVPDWRWMLHRTDSPWYPSARLFRQTQPSDWAGVIADVKAALQTFDAGAR